MFSNTKINALETKIKDLEKIVEEQEKTIDDIKANIDKTVSDYIQDTINVVDRIHKLEKTLNPFIHNEERKEGPEPYISVLSESWHPEFGIELKLDWNDAMINFLKRNGYAGVDDEQIVQQYVHDLFRDKIQEVRT